MLRLVLAALLLTVVAPPVCAASLLDRFKQRFEGIVKSTIEPLFEEMKGAVRSLTGADSAPQNDGQAEGERKTEALVTPDEINDSQAASRFNERNGSKVARELSKKDVLPYMNSPSGGLPAPTAPDKKRLQPAKWRSSTIEPSRIQSLRDSQ